MAQSDERHEGAHPLGLGIGVQDFASRSKEKR